MRALSIKQYWLWAITDGDKRVENRVHVAPDWILGRRIGLHASKVIEGGSAGEIFTISGLVVPDPVPLGSIVATAIIKENVITQSVKDELGSATTLRVYEDKWFFGPFGWILKDVVKLDEPIEHTGALGFWRIEALAAAEIARQLESRL